MFVVIETRDTVSSAYKAGFEREGYATLLFGGGDFLDWIKSTAATDLAAVQCIIIGEVENRVELPALIRSFTKTPIIALKESVGLDETLSLFTGGVDDVVRKPATVREIIARTNAIWRRASDQRAEATNGRLTVYFDSRDPVIDGVPMELPRRERQILEYLVRNKKRRIPKNQLFSAIYGLYNDNVDETVIEGHVSKLRKKLRQRLGFDAIDAKRFAGYAFIGDVVAPADRPCEVDAPAWLKHRKRPDDAAPSASYDASLGQPMPRVLNDNNASYRQRPHTV